MKIEFRCKRCDGLLFEQFLTTAPDIRDIRIKMQFVPGPMSSLLEYPYSQEVKVGVCQCLEEMDDESRMEEDALTYSKLIAPLEQSLYQLRDEIKHVEKRIEKAATFIGEAVQTINEEITTDIDEAEKTIQEFKEME
jgi:septal ring factor EnvC (AmiA/AmiB activator)